MSEKSTPERSTSGRSRRKMIAGAVAAVAATGVAGAKPKTEKKVYRTGPKPEQTPLFSPAVSYGNLLFLSGIGYHKEGDIKVHTQGVLDDIKKQLEAAGSSMDKVLKCTVFLADLKDYAAMNEVFRGKFGEDPPVRTTVSVAGVPANSLVEMDVIAYI
jgi:2-iminobutanoate/2-iminopropanoate deaminase